MKPAMMMMLGVMVAMLGACQSDMSGSMPASASNGPLAAPANNPYPDVAVGDAYFETMIGRYQWEAK